MSEPEWISWGPDSPGYPKCPVAPGTDCEVRFAGGSTTRGTMPESFGWWYDGSYGDIIAYRVWPAKDDAQDGLLRELAMTELVNIEGASADWLAGFQAATERVRQYLERNR